MGGDTIVPPTTIRVGPDGRGSVQQFVDGTIPRVGPSDGTVEEKSKRRMLILDALTGNSDRHSGNVLFREVRPKVFRPVAIDNGLCFPGEAAQKTYVRVPYGMGIDARQWALRADEIAMLKRIDIDDLIGKMHKLKFDESEVRAMVLRIEALMADPKLLQTMASAARNGDTEIALTRFVRRSVVPDAESPDSKRLLDKKGRDAVRQRVQSVFGAKKK